MLAIPIIDAPPPARLDVSVHETWLGVALRALDDQGTRSLILGDDETALRADLSRAFPMCTAAGNHSL
jgi:hypothetical protein